MPVNRLLAFDIPLREDHPKWDSKGQTVLSHIGTMFFIVLETSHCQSGPGVSFVLESTFRLIV